MSTQKMTNRTLGSLTLLAILASFANGNNNLEYGPCELKVLRQEVCAGPKQRSCAFVQLRSDPTRQLLHQDVNVTEEVSPESAKIQAFTISSQKKGKEVMRYQMNKPCEHNLLRSILNKAYNITGKCLIRKGFYPVTLNLTQIHEEYYGGKFFYGNLSIRSSFFSKKCNFSCIVVDITIVPKAS